MFDTLPFRTFLGRCRGNASFVEIELLSKEYSLYRYNKKDLEHLTILKRDPQFEARSSLEAYELRGLEVYGELWLDAESDTEIAWIAPVGIEAVTPGPHEISAASMVFFGRPFRTRVGRSPKTMRICRAGVCAECGSPAENAHHLVPVAHGGEDTEDNLCPLCGSHHKRRHRDSGTIAISKTRSMIEVLGVIDSFLFYHIVKVLVLPEKREYQTVWSRELIDPIPGLYDANIKWINRALNVQHAEPVKQVQSA